MSTDKPGASDASNPLEKACAAMGGRQAVAEQYRVQPSAIGNWKARGVPLELVPFIVRDSGCVVTCDELRPDKAEFFALVRSLPPGEQLAQPAAPAGQPQGA